MKMVWHDNIGCNIDLLFVEVVKPFIDGLKGISQFKQVQPLVGEGDKVKAVSVLAVLQSDCHQIKLAHCF